jgi:hypothetical protein
MGKLCQLYLNNNKIVSLNNSVFRYLNQLQTLDLCYNALQNIDALIFSRLSELRSLSLCHNNVSRIDITLLHAVVRIGKVDLEGNPWICDCDSANVYSSCVKNKNCNLNLICEFPDNLKQSHWSVIETLKCRTTTVSVIAISLSEKETTNATDQTEVSIWSIMSSESSAEESTSETDDNWYYVMIAFSVLSPLAFISCVILCVIYRRKSRYPNADQVSRYPNGDQDINEFSRLPQNANPQVLETRETVFQH